MLRVAFNRDDVDSFRLVGVNLDRESEIGGQVAADLLPRLTSVVTTHDVPVLLHEQHVWTRWVHGNAMNAVTYLRSWIRNVFGFQSPVRGPPGLSRVVGAEHTRSGDSDEHPRGIAGIEKDGVQAHPTGAWRPFGP